MESSAAPSGHSSVSRPVRGGSDCMTDCPAHPFRATTASEPSPSTSREEICSRRYVLAQGCMSSVV